MNGRPLIRAVTAVSLVALVAAGVVVTTGLNHEPIDVTATFDDASGVRTGYQVRTDGVQVGNVSAVRVEHNRARLTLSVDPAVLPLHQDAHALIRPANLLGESYIELNPGSPTAPVLDPPALTVRQTSSSVTFQEVLNTFDDPTSTALAALVTSLGEGVRGAGGNAADAVRALRPAMERTNELSSILAGQNDVLNQLVDRTQPVADALATGGGRQLDHLLDSTRQTVDTLAANRHALDQTLGELPATVTAARRTLARLARTADAATPTLRSVRPVTDNLTDITGELHTLTESTDPALASLNPVLDTAHTLLEQARPVVSGLRAAGPDLRDTAGGLEPIGEQLLDKDQHLVDLMQFVRKWALSTNGSDGISHYFRGVVHASPAAFQQFIAGSPVGGPLARVAPGTAARLPDLPGTGQRPSAPSGSATGMSAAQERSMVGQLLGGH